MLRERQGDWRGAVAAFAAAADHDQEWASRYYRLGMARERMWDLAGAADAYSAAVRLAPGRAGWAQQVTRARTDAAQFEPFHGHVIAHRGRAGDSAENHPKALAQLPSLVSGVEVDVRLSRDGVPVLMHDATVDRTTDGRGETAKLPYAQLRALECQGGASGVPALPDYLEACKGHGFRYVLLDLKVPAHPGLRAVIEAVAGSPVADSCVLLVRDIEQLRRLRDAGGDLRLGLLGAQTNTLKERLSAAQECGAEMLFVAHGDHRYLANRAVVAEVQRVGLRAGGSIINSRDGLEATRQDRCDLILTDQADQLCYFTGRG